MKRITGLFAVLLVVASADAASPNGFAVWSHGTGYDRYLVKLDLQEGVVPDMSKAQKICKKGRHGGDIQANISLDGKFVAFSRSLPGAKNRYGPNDYHFFGHWDIYIVRVDGPLPATPIKVGHGYWPSWGTDSDRPTKTLYYSVFEGAKIKKATIGPDGKVIKTEEHCKVPTREHFMMCAPDGKRVVYRNRGKMRVRHVGTGRDVAVGGGCHPEWCTDSWWVMWARCAVGTADGKNTKRSGLGQYHYGCSNDMKWVITRVGARGNDQNTGHPIWFFTLDCSKEGDAQQYWRVQKQHQVGVGNFPDIHVFTGPSAGITADPENGVTGGSSTVTWTSSNATRLTLGGRPAAPSGSKTVTRSGTYKVVATDDAGKKAQAEVTVTFSDPYAAAVDPKEARIAVSKSVELGALDQAGGEIRASWRVAGGQAPLAVPTALTGVAGGGRLSRTSGAKTTFTSDGTKGVHQVSASAGGRTASVEITVYDPADIHLRINTGPNQHGAAGWERDDAHVSGGEDFDFGRTPDTEGVANAAPASVYRTCRHSDHSYSFGKVPDGTYLVRIHFYDTHGGGRKMDYTIEEKKVLDGFAPPKGAATVREFTVTVSDGNGLQIEAKRGRGNDVFESGIEIIAR